MNDNKLFTLLKSLSVDQFRWFYKFVKSPYYNHNKHLVKLYEILRPFYPDFDAPKLSQEYLSKKLFPDSKYDVQRIRLLFHRLSNLLENFIVVELLKEDTFLYKKLLAKSLGKGNAYNLFQKKTMQLLEELNTSTYRDEAYFKNSQEINLQFYSHPATNRQQHAMNYLEDAMTSLDSFFVLSKLKLACAIKERTRALSEQYEIQYLDMAIEKTEWSNFLVNIYAKILDMQEEAESIEEIEKVKRLFINNMGKIDFEDQRNILHLLLNFCTRLINKGGSKYIHELLELYKIGLNYNFILVNNELSETTFNNIVMIGTGCKEFEWTKSFINQYGTHLNKSIREDAITLSFAIWNFRKGEYEAAINLIYNYSFSKPLQIVLSKTLLIRTYVELFLQDISYYNLSIAQINTFEKYIRSHKIVSEQIMDGYLNFTRFTRKMVNHKSRNKDTSKLEQDIRNARNVRLKKWLLEKVEKK